MLVWFIIACILFALEIITTGFALLGLALGGVFAGIAAALGAATQWQIVVFIIISILFFFFVRPLLTRWWKKHEVNLPKTNAEALIGRTGKVVESINLKDKTGRVQIDGDNFRAITKNDEIIPEGNPVRVLAIDSTILIVKREDVKIKTSKIETI